MNVGVLHGEYTNALIEVLIQDPCLPGIPKLREDCLYYMDFLEKPLLES